MSNVLRAKLFVGGEQTSVVRAHFSVHSDTTHRLVELIVKFKRIDINSKELMFRVSSANSLYQGILDVDGGLDGTKRKRDVIE